MTDNHHETLVYRLVQILIRLNQGEKLDPQSLADEFNVSLRTVQRDMNERFAYLPIQKTAGLYHLDPICLGKLSTRDIEQFASLSGLRGLYPSLSNDFLQDIFDSRIRGTLLVQGHHYEDIAGKEKLFRTIEHAISERHPVSFDYVRDGIAKPYVDIAPYRLINSKGIWYLAALDGEKLKTFAFTKIESLRSLDGSFAWDATIDSRLTAEGSVWLADEKLEIKLKISEAVASYFKRRTLIANQVIEEERADGSLIVSTKVGHLNQVLPIVRYWIPHIRIISPEGLQGELDESLSAYLRPPPTEQ